MRRIAGAAWLPALLGLLAAAVAPCLAAAETGERLPEFALPTFDGPTASRASLLGKPAVIVFWNTWCPDCMAELPKIDQVARRLAPKGVAVLAVNTGLNDSERKARAYWKEGAFAFPSGFDATFEVGKALKVLGVPLILLVDADGFVRFRGSRLPADAETRLTPRAGPH